MTRSPKSQEEEAHAEFAFPRHLALELGVDQFLDALLGHCPSVSGPRPILIKSVGR